jgi:hypothetical protein
MRIQETEREWVNHPEGQYQGVCVDVVDLGMQPTQYGDKHKCRIVFETEHEIINDDDGTVKNAIVGKRFTVSLYKSNLLEFIESWRGRKLTKEETADFDTEQLIGANAMLQITHEQGSDGKTYDHIQSIMKLPRNMQPMKPSGSYVRVQDREQEQPQRNARSQQPQRNAQPARRAATPAPAARRPAATAGARRTAPAPKPVEDDFSDFPGALEDEDDDLPF